MSEDLLKRIATLEGVIADALTAIDEGRRGDARKILKTGSAPQLKTTTGVMAKDRAS